MSDPIHPTAAPGGPEGSRPLGEEVFEADESRATFGHDLNEALNRVRTLKEIHGLFWTDLEKSNYHDNILQPLEELNLEFSSGTSSEIELQRKLNLINERIDKLLTSNNPDARVVELIAAYIVEHRVLDRSAKELSPEKVIEKALEMRINIDEVFRAAVVEYTTYKLTHQLRESNVRQIANLKNSKAGKHWLLRFLAGNLGTAASHAFINLCLRSTGQQPEDNPLAFQIAHTVTGAVSSGLASYLTGSTKLAEVEEGYQTLSRVQQAHKNGELAGDISPNAHYHELLRRYNKMFTDGRFSGEEHEAMDLLNAITQSKAKAEMEIAYRETTRESDESDSAYRGRVLTAFKFLQTKGSESAKQEETIRVLNERYFAKTGKNLSLRMKEAVAWSAIGGLFSNTFPGVGWSPTAPADSLTKLAICSAKARYAHLSQLEWVPRFERERNKLEAVTGVEGETLETLPNPQPIRTLRPIDRRAFYINREVNVNTSKNDALIIKDKRFLSPEQIEQMQISLEHLKQVLPSLHGYFFFSRDLEGNPQAYRLWSCGMKKGNPYSRPDTSNWPNLQEKPGLQHVVGIPYGEFVARPFDIESLYTLDSTTGQPVDYEDMNTEEFQLSWNLPPHLWRPKNDAPNAGIYDYRTVLPFNHAGKRTQAFIRPDQITRYAYEVANGLDLERLVYAFIKAREENITKIDDILEIARS